MTTKTRPEFDYKTTASGLGYNGPQKMARALWAPMFAMALMAWPVGLILSWARASIIADFGAGDVGALRLSHLVPAFMFIGFTAVFAAISFAIARILGAFRKGGGEVQESTGGDVQTLKVPTTGRIFVLTMMTGMMMLIVAIILHFVAAANVETWSADTVGRWGDVLEGFRRLGVAMYLFGIAFGLGTIIHVLRFQSQRIRQLSRI